MVQTAAAGRARRPVAPGRTAASRRRGGADAGAGTGAAAGAQPSRADLTRRRILEAASRVFRRQGLAATGMRDIAAALGMHVGNLYSRFGDRSGLLAFCQEGTLERLRALGAAVEAGRARADEKLRALIAGHV